MKHSNGDWFKYYRSSTESEFYFVQSFTKWQAWVDLLTLAAFAPRTVFIRGIEFHLQAGDLIESQKALAKRWKWSDNTARKFLNLLSTRGQISIKVRYRISVISIVNWQEYQGTDNEGAPQTALPIRKNKNVKEDICFAIGRDLLLAEDKNLYSVLNRFKKEFGSEEGLKKQLGRILGSETRFETAGRLAGYLTSCLRNNGHSKPGQSKTKPLPEINRESEPWMNG